MLPKRQSIVLLAVLTIVAPPLGLARSQTPDELAQTARFVAAFQNPDGGFAGAAGQKSSLGSTSSAIRILKFVGGSIKDVPGCVAYVKSCYDEKSGGFAPAPGGKADVRTTSVGLMAVAELKMGPEPYVSKAIAYYSENAVAWEDVRIAIAGLEAVGKSSPDFDKWRAMILKDRNEDGSWGKGPASAYETGGRAAALLRMGQAVDKREGVLKAMRAGQTPEGGFTKTDGPADFDASYRIMRAFYMMKAKPDLDALRGWIAKFRQSDGGYSAKPGAPADLGGTYFASIILYWARQLDGEPALIETAGFKPLFNGRDLSGWEGDAELWAARDGKIVGTSPGIRRNEFLATEGSYKDFILKLSFRMRGDDSSNSGVMFRAVRVPGTEMSGYQADVGQNYWGCLYDESRRNKVLVPAQAKAVAAVHKNDWNHYVIRAMGSKITLTLNGVTSVTYDEPDASIARDGRIALQIHAGKPMTVEFKDIYIQPLPDPAADGSTAPGFKLRTVASGGKTRKYSAYLPKGYDGEKSFPVVLFLHGSGERGSDGVTSAQVGLGSAILNRPDDFPAIAVFPQAERTWSADSEDAAAALAALDDVLANFKADKSRVALTGLSMGGRGAWEIAAANPGRFSAVAPVCGMGRTETSDVLKNLPVWVFVGDDDRDATVLNSRAMAAAIRSSGGSPKYTEYRAVGHNSWDRAYNDVVFLDWLLSQKRSGR